MKTRIDFLDNLRTFAVFLVIVVHAGMTYERGFDAFWIVSDPAKFDTIALVRLHLDLFVMFLLFFISGYFIPNSVNANQLIPSFFGTKKGQPFLIDLLMLP